MSFILQARRDNKDILEAIFSCSFIKDIVKGSLPKKSFDYYITQDMYFLYDYIRAAGACAAKAEDEDVPFFIELQATIYKALENTNSFYTNSDNFHFTSAIAPAYLNFSSFLLQTAYQGSIEEGFSALFPIPLIYMHIGKEYRVPESHPYFRWLKGNGLAFVEETVQDFENVINRRAAEAPALNTLMAQRVRASLFHMYYFFQDCSKRSDFNSVKDLPQEEAL